ncbi:MAG: hypothetical protein EHM14_10490 [Methanothrix sp.]|nr:MAG: hypothetical protein EHM14_10490 [Methanothrix sp.]
MQITSSYMGCLKGNYNYLFFLLIEDYISEQKHLSETIENALKTLARRLGDRGVVIVPFQKDENKIKDEIISKNWTKRERSALWKSPGLLLIGEDFANFDPCKSNGNWIYIPLEDLIDTSRMEKMLVIFDLFDALTKACENDISIPDLREQLKQRNLSNRAKRVIDETQIQFGPIATNIADIKETINICLDYVSD